MRGIDRELCFQAIYSTGGSFLFSSLSPPYSNSLQRGCIGGVAGLIDTVIAPLIPTNRYPLATSLVRSIVVITTLNLFGAQIAILKTVFTVIAQKTVIAEPNFIGSMYNALLEFAFVYIFLDQALETILFSLATQLAAVHTTKYVIIPMLPSKIANHTLAQVASSVALSALFNQYVPEKHRATLASIALFTALRLVMCRLTPNEAPYTQAAKGILDHLPQSISVTDSQREEIRIALEAIAKEAQEKAETYVSSSIIDDLQPKAMWRIIGILFTQEQVVHSALQTGFNKLAGIQKQLRSSANPPFNPEDSSEYLIETASSHIQAAIPRLSQDDIHYLAAEEAIRQFLIQHDLLADEARIRAALQASVQALRSGNTSISEISSTFSDQEGEFLLHLAIWQYTADAPVSSDTAPAEIQPDPIDLGDCVKDYLEQVIDQAIFDKYREKATALLKDITLYVLT